MVSIREKIAEEIERKSVGSAQGWTEEDLHAWCHSDPFGKKSYNASLAIADHLLDIFEIKDK